MSKTPYFPQFIRQRVDMFALGAPVSTYDALVMVSNLQWCIDMHPQHRINWTAPAADEAGFDTFYLAVPPDEGGPDQSVMWTQEFAHTWIRGDYPTGLDICVAALVGAGDLTLRARVVPAATQIGDLSVAALFDDEATASGALSTAVVEGQVFFDAPVNQAEYFLTHAINEDGTARSVKQGLLRIEITMTVGEADYGALTEVLVREFACQS